jgi:hypothetical protein
MDSGSWILWNNLFPRLGNSAYGWDQVHNSQAGDAIVQFSLSAGSHTLEIAYRENGLYIDEFQITNDLGYTPVGPSFPGAGWSSQDVGAVSAAGSFSESAGAFTVTGSGADIWGSADEFHFVYKQWTGDGTLIARVNTFGSNCSSHAHARGAVMMRNDLNANGVRIMTASSVVPSSLYRLIWRSTAGSSSSAQTGGDSNPPVWLRLVRSGNTFTGSTSTNGTSWTPLGTSQTLNMSSTMYVGLAVTSHSDGNLCTVTFDNVSIQ